jgi:hypothetical protein
MLLSDRFSREKEGVINVLRKLRVPTVIVTRRKHESSVALLAPTLLTVLQPP